MKFIDKKDKKLIKAAIKAKKLNRCITYIDDDCEVIVMPSGYAFYNAFYNIGDWY